jgi:hypothetical protein
MSDLRVVWKYPIPEVGTDEGFFIPSWAPGGGGFELELPLTAEVLRVATQKGAPHMWILVDPQAPKITRRFQVVGTEQAELPQTPIKYVGTWTQQLFSGVVELVFHVFELPRDGDE